MVFPLMNPALARQRPGRCSRAADPFDAKSRRLHTQRGRLAVRRTLSPAEYEGQRNYHRPGAFTAGRRLGERDAGIAAGTRGPC